MSYFKGKRILITGAGSGIGALMARELGQNGAEIIVTARRSEAANQVADEIKQAGGKAEARILDVSDLDSIAPFHQQLQAETGPIDVLINNAGVVFGGEFEKVPLKDHLNTFQINALGLMTMTHAFMPDLLNSGQSHLVNIASASAFVGLPYGSTYAASKWAVLGFSESVRLELKERGYNNVKVTTVCPSYISTGMFDGVRSPLLSPMLTPEKVVKSILRGTRQGTPLIHEPLMVRSVDLLKGALPRPIWDEVAMRTGIASSMKSWRGKH